jgi:DNA repair exonuclease SbcCD ATPase subunit
LKRVYIHNFRAFANFECRLDPLVLLMGANGTGKTSLFEALEQVQRFSGVGLPADATFLRASLNRWTQDEQQTFEFDVELDGVTYRLRLRTQLPEAPLKPRVVEERTVN